jgi:hypothetical protein
MNKLKLTALKAKGKEFHFFLLFRMGKFVLGNQLHPNAADVEDDSKIKQLIVGSESQYSRQERFRKI